MSVRRPSRFLLASALAAVASFFSPARAQTDFCDPAPFVGPITPVPIFVNGDTTTATFDAFPPCAAPITARNQYFKIIGTGNVIVITTCPSVIAGTFAQYNSRISVYCTECDAPVCIAENDDSCATNPTWSTVRFCSLPGQEYIVMIHGNGASAGQYRLAVADIPGGCGGATPCPDGGGPPDCRYLVDFESQPLGTVYGAPVGDVPGTLIFTENLIPVRVQNFTSAGGGIFFNLGEIDPAFSGFGDSHTARANNINYDFRAVMLPGTVAQVTFEFADLGGTENLRVNGGPLHVGNIATFPAAIAPGVTYAVTTFAIPGGIRGEVTLTGNVQLLVVGGQEFWIDNVCFRLRPCPTDCDGNGIVNAADVGCFLTIYFDDIANGTTNADYDGNGMTNAADVGAFLTDYFASLGPC